jgi:GDP-L-fucose synthase
VKILVTGGTGLVGRNLQEILPEAYYVSSTDVNLTDYNSTYKLFNYYKPTHVIHLASKVGGILYNMKYPVEFFEHNLMMNINVLNCAHKFKIQNFIGMLSTCIFPNDVIYPLTPEKIHSGEPHYSNFGYAYAKRMLEVQIRTYNKQHGTNWTTIIPTNIYGKYDEFNLEKSHVIPALIHKMYLNKINNQPSMNIIGTGLAEREFIYAEDLGKILAWAIENYTNSTPLLVSSETSYSIKTVAELISTAMEYKGELIFDGNESNDGQYRKPSDSTIVRSICPINYTPLHIGIKNTIEWFLKNYNTYSRK